MRTAVSVSLHSASVAGYFSYIYICFHFSCLMFTLVNKSLFYLNSIVGLEFAGDLVLWCYCFHRRYVCRSLTLVVSTKAYINILNGAMQVFINEMNNNLLLFKSCIVYILIGICCIFTCKVMDVCD